MPSIRIVTAPFRAETYGQGPTENRECMVGTWLVRLRDDPENASTFFALVSDIPELQPVQPCRLPEYLVGTALFENSTRLPT